MRDFEDRELILQKALANKILQDLAPAKNKINKITDKIIDDIADVEKKLQNAADIQKIAVYSKDLKIKQILRRLKSAKSFKFRSRRSI